MRGTHVTTLVHVDLRACPLLVWIALRISFSKCSRLSKLKFKAKSYGVLVLMLNSKSPYRSSGLETGDPENIGFIIASG